MSTATTKKHIILLAYEAWGEYSLSSSLTMFQCETEACFQGMQDRSACLRRVLSSCIPLTSRSSQLRTTSIASIPNCKGHSRRMRPTSWGRSGTNSACALHASDEDAFRLVGLINEGATPFDTTKLDAAFEEAYNKLLARDPITCAHTGVTHKALEAPVAVIIDVSL